MPILTVERRKQKNLIGVMALVFIITSLVLYFGFFKRGVPAPEALEKEAEILKGAREIKLNLDLFEEERFRNLVPYEKLPREIKTGRINPFVPYNVAEPLYIREQFEALEEEISPAEGEATSTRP